jgi:hypothetical protein
MAKKKESKSNKAKVSGKKAAAPRPPAREPDAETAAARATASAPKDAEQAPRESDARLPPPGTVLRKLARDGSVRCECTVEEAGGIRYKDTLYRSLSAAAMAAAKDLGLTNKTQNGWVFWGVTKAARPAGDPLEALGRAWERYRERATSVVGSVKDDDRARVLELIDQHVEVIKELRGRVA